jgi:porphobilinogen deaminase
VVVSADGTVAVRTCATGPAAEAARLGQEVAAELRRGGAEKHMASTDGLLSRGDDDR